MEKTKKDINRLKAKYASEVVPALIKQFGYKNVNEVPKIEKIVLNMRLGDVKDNSKSFNLAVEELGTIAGQKPLVTKAKKSVANFKLREGMNIGAKVTLHGDNMWDFLYRFINISLPRVRDFRGLPRRGFDGRGNYTLGIKEQTIFVEIDIEKISQTLGMDISFVTSAKTDDEGRALLEGLGFPFRKQEVR